MKKVSPLMGPEQVAEYSYADPSSKYTLSMFGHSRPAVTAKHPPKPAPRASLNCRGMIHDNPE